MTKREMVMEAIESLGYKPHIDEDGDVYVRYQMKNLFFIIGDEEEPYVSAVLPQFAEVEEGEETYTLAVCNRICNEVKLVKVYIDKSLKSVSACCSFFYTDMECMRFNVENALNILGIVRSVYDRYKAECADILAGDE